MACLSSSRTSNSQDSDVLVPALPSAQECLRLSVEDVEQQGCLLAVWR